MKILNETNMDALTSEGIQDENNPYSDMVSCYYDYCDEDFPDTCEELPEPPEPNWDEYPEPEEPDWDDFPGPEYPFHDTVEREIDGTRVIVSTECGGTERLDEKVMRLISSEQEEI